MSKVQEKQYEKPSSASSGSGSGGSSSSSGGGSSSSSSSSSSAMGGGGGGGGRDNFARDNSGIVGGMTDRTGEALTATASSFVPPATPQQLSAWQTQWPNITLKDFDSSVKYFNTVTKKDLSSQKKTVSGGWWCEVWCDVSDDRSIE